MKDQKKNEPLDLDHMVRELGCVDTAKRILQRYAQHTEIQIERLQEAINSGTMSEIHRISHSVKGGAMNIGADRLVETARTLEFAAKSEQLENAPFFIQDIKKAFSDVQRAIIIITREN